MAQLINLTVMGGNAAPYNPKGATGNEFSSTLSGSATGVSEVQAFLVQNIIKVRDFFQPTTGTTYPAVASIVNYKSINPTNGRYENVKMCVHEARAAILSTAG